MQSVEIEIYGKKYYLKSDEPEVIQKCAKFLDKYITEVNKSLNILDSSKLFLFSALLLSEDYIKLEKDFKNLQTEVNRVESLVNKNI